MGVKRFYKTQNTKSNLNNSIILESCKNCGFIFDCQVFCDCPYCGSQ